MAVALTVLSAPGLGKDLVTEAVAGVPARDEKGLPLQQPVRVIGGPRLNPGPRSTPGLLGGADGAQKRHESEDLAENESFLCARVASDLAITGNV